MLVEPNCVNDGMIILLIIVLVGLELEMVVLGENLSGGGAGLMAFISFNDLLHFSIEHKWIHNAISCQLLQIWYFDLERC